MPLNNPAYFLDDFLAFEDFDLTDLITGFEPLQPQVLHIFKLLSQNEQFFDYLNKFYLIYRNCQTISQNYFFVHILFIRQIMSFEVLGKKFSKGSISDTSGLLSPLIVMPGQPES